MEQLMGKHAIVIGAGIGGLLFSRVLASHFQRVTVLERDSLPDDNQPRSGIPQGRHLHSLLAGGCRAMEGLLPGLVSDLRAGGAIEVLSGLQNMVERPGYDPFPRRHAGFSSYSMSRPLLELCVRRRVQSTANITVQQEVAVERLTHANAVVTGVALRDGRQLDADFVIDASGRGELTLRLLDDLGLPRPRETTIGVDMHYASVLFEIPADAAYDWKSVVTFPKAPHSSKGLLMTMIEGGRWICAVGWRGDEAAPTDRESYVEWTRNLRTQTAYKAIKDATMIGKVVRFAFPESRHRHFVELESLPSGVLPVADAICRFNPIYGQGMSVAALEAEAFAGLLKAPEQDFGQLSRSFFEQADRIIEGPWNMAALPDLLYPDTRGERPADLMNSLRFGQAFLELAARDAAVHKLQLEIHTLLKPRSAMTGDPALMQRILAVMSETNQQAMVAAS